MGVLVELSKLILDWIADVPTGFCDCCLRKAGGVSHQTFWVSFTGSGKSQAFLGWTGFVSRVCCTEISCKGGWTKDTVVVGYPPTSTPSLLLQCLWAKEWLSGTKKLSGFDYLFWQGSICWYYSTDYITLTLRRDSQAHRNKKGFPCCKSLMVTASFLAIAAQLSSICCWRRVSDLSRKNDSPGCLLSSLFLVPY